MERSTSPRKSRHKRDLHVWGCLCCQFNGGSRSSSCPAAMTCKPTSRPAPCWFWICKQLYAERPAGIIDKETEISRQIYSVQWFAFVETMNLMLCQLLRIHVTFPKRPSSTLPSRIIVTYMKPIHACLAHKLYSKSIKLIYIQFTNVQ